MSNKEQVSRKRVQDLLIAGVRYRGCYKECSDYFAELRRQLGEQICGPPFCLYTDRVSQGGIEIECCFPVRQAVEMDKIHSRMLAGGEVLALTHYGPYQSLGESWEALFDYVEGNNIPVRGPRREVYLRDAPDEKVTELLVPLA
jgi:effector-binding domain-containing protein